MGNTSSNTNTNNSNNTSNNSSKKSDFDNFDNVIDFIASYYILTMDFKSLKNLDVPKIIFKCA